MPDPALFNGIAVLIDDEIADETSNIKKIKAQIEEKGCHVLGLTAIPDATGLANLGGASFFIVDWNLYGTAVDAELGSPVSIPEGLSEQHTVEMVSFLKDLKKVRLAPVFIFTNESVSEITNELKEHPELYDETDPSHISVVSKADILSKGVFSVLENWLKQAPSAYVLKRWELEYERAKNVLFGDFYSKSVLWPLILKKTFEQDDVSASLELGNLIGRNLRSRMTPFEFDLDQFDDAALKVLEGDKENYQAVLMKVLEGERFVPQDQLQPDSISPGDVFKEGGKYFVNVRPECDCIPRGGTKIDDMELYLLAGDKLSPAKVASKYVPKYGTITETDSETIIFALTGSVTVSFRLKELSIKKWGECKGHRIGRLLPPFLTRVQQRFSAYLQRPGLGRVPVEAVGDTTEVNTPPAASAPLDTRSILSSLFDLWTVTVHTIRKAFSRGRSEAGRD
jgi:hypothetical protein